MFLTAVMTSLAVVVVLVVARQIFKYYGQAPGYQNLDYYAKTPCTPAQKKMSASRRRDQHQHQHQHQH